MNIENLEVGKTFRNLRHLQEVLGIPIGVSSNSKNAQLKELARYCKYNRQGHKLTIEEIHEFPLDKVDNRGGNNLLKVPLTISNPLLAEEWLIEENKMSIPQALTRRSTQKFWWKCGKCENKIFTSPLKRLKGATDNCIICPYCNMSKGAKRIYTFLCKYDIEFKLEYMFDDLIGIGNKSYVLTSQYLTKII